MVHLLRKDTYKFVYPNQTAVSITFDFLKKFIQKNFFQLVDCVVSLFFLPMNTILGSKRPKLRRVSSLVKQPPTYVLNSYWDSTILLHPRVLELQREFLPLMQAWTNRTCEKPTEHENNNINNWFWFQCQWNGNKKWETSASYRETVKTFGNWPTTSWTTGELNIQWGSKYRACPVSLSSCNEVKFLSEQVFVILL